MAEVLEDFLVVQLERPPLPLCLLHLVAQDLLRLLRLVELLSKLSLPPARRMLHGVELRARARELVLGHLGPVPRVTKLLPEVISVCLGPPAMPGFALPLCPGADELLLERVDLGGEVRELLGEISFGHEQPRSTSPMVSLPRGWARRAHSRATR